MVEIGDDLLDSRDIDARIAELEAQDSEDDGSGLDELEREELVALTSFRDEARDSTAEWEDGASFIHERYFTEYAEELASDITDYDPRNCSWPYTCIDWDKAASDLQMDYTEVDFQGHTYYVRA